MSLLASRTARRLTGLSDTPGRRRRLLALLAVLLVALFVVFELLLMRSYQQTADTTRDFGDTTDTTTAIANVQREVLTLHHMIDDLDRDGGSHVLWQQIELRHGLLKRQLSVVDAAASARPSIGGSLQTIERTLARFEDALAAAPRSGQLGEPTHRSLEQPLLILDKQVKFLFDEEEHALYGALGRTLDERAEGQRFVVGLSVLALILSALLAAAIWRAVRRDFQRAYTALADEAREREQLQEKLWHQATHDALTGLANRVQFEAELAKEQINSAVLYIDLDGFKTVNDEFGHDGGDELLRIVAKRLAGVTRTDDRVARLGGDEFALLARGVPDAATAVALAERVRSAISAPFALRGRQATVDASVGVALGAPGLGEDELIRCADLAMYAAKHTGKGAVRVHDATLAAEAGARAELEQDIRCALERDEFELHYQPVLELETEAVVGFEALIRWRHPERGMMAPGAFLPLAERLGMDREIGAWVVSRACHDAIALTAPEGTATPPWVSVNISPDHLEDAGLIDDVRLALCDSGLVPERLVLEISERCALTSAGAPTATLAALEDLGVSIALDDFGTGQTALSALRFMAIDVLKLDKSLIDDIACDPHRLRVGRALVELGSSLNMTVVAEGVESADQASALAAIGCQCAQGFLWSKAVELPQAVELLDHWAANEAVPRVLAG